MTHIRLVIISLALLFTTACANIGPADDGFENSHESVDIGRLPTTEILARALRKATERVDAEENKKASE